MAARKMILISQEKYDRLMKSTPIEHNKETPPIDVNSKQKAPSINRTRKATSIDRKRKAPPPGEPASKLARRVLKFKRY